MIAVDDLAATLAQARRASRFTAAYTQRMLGYVRAFEDGITARLHAVTPDLQLDFEHWETHRHGPVPEHGTRPHRDRWVWDFMPMLATTFRWRTHERPEPRAIRVGLRVELDSGWDASQGEPNPVELRDAAACVSPVAAWVYRVEESGPASTWDDPSRTAPPAGFVEDGSIKVLGATPFRFVRRLITTDLAQLPDRASLHRLLVEPIAEVFRAG